MKRTILWILSLGSLCLINTSLWACDSSETSILVRIQTDSWGGETSWEITGNTGEVYHRVPFNTYNSGQLYETEVCVPKGVCFIFSIRDQYGDGIDSPGFFELLVDGQLELSNPAFVSEYLFEFNCPIGATCLSATSIEEGNYVATPSAFWYIFTPDTTGTFEISTCDNTCDTRIWVYDRCLTDIDDSNEGTIFYDDNYGACGFQAQVKGLFAKDRTYYIRIGDTEEDCGLEEIKWSIYYDGPIVGCTDPSSCNFNPLASVDDGTCIPQGSPDCPDGPDLAIHQGALETSIYLTTINSSDNCTVKEGCLQGYGQRDVVRFDTRIDNIGELDYFIGEPFDNADQFTFDNCHNHYHYDGYAEYVLYDENGTEIPIGFKNGFCVIDLGCDTGSAKYSCENMGITAGCFDEYVAQLDCQWIDVTDVPDGRYVFVTRVNWDNAVDALGNIEKDTANNWAQVCIILDRSSGALQFRLDEGCPPYVDCAGQVFGSSQPDCTGECGGTTLMGDLDLNSLQDIEDVYQYVNRILDANNQATPCNDLNADNRLSVYDAALLNSCLIYGQGHIHTGGGNHDHCNFPDGVLNINHTVQMGILDHNPSEKYFVIGMDNRSVDVVAYEFDMNGLVIQEVESVIDPNDFPVTTSYSLDGRVVALSYPDSSMHKSAAMSAVCRVYYSALTEEEVCISQINDIVSSDYEQVLTEVVDGCWLVVDTYEPLTQLQVVLQPNPFHRASILRFTNPDAQAYQLILRDVRGRLLRTYADIRGNEVLIERGQLADGIYFYELTGGQSTYTGRLAVQ
ncbi:MAG: lysyl oxidase family protein [Bacteroidota bacterium]